MHNKYTDAMRIVNVSARVIGITTNEIYAFDIFNIMATPLIFRTYNTLGYL